jgi:hypothetical protein
MVVCRTPRCARYAAAAGVPQVVSVSGLLGHPLRTILDELYRALYTNYEDINGDQARRRRSAPLP